MNGAASTTLKTNAEKDEVSRTIAARWIITARLQFSSASQIGSHEADHCDQTFSRTQDGRVLLQGSTLAGALRSVLTDLYDGDRSPEPTVREVRRRSKTPGERPLARAPWVLFGDEESHQSPLIIFDSTADTPATNVRDSVSIDPKTGLAREHFKFDREVCLPGLSFPIRVELLVPGPDLAPYSPYVSLTDVSEQTLVADLCAALNELAQGSIRFGARKSRGLGECRAVDFRARRFRLADPDDGPQEWRDYATIDHLDPLRDIEAFKTPVAAVREAWQEFQAPEVSDQRQRLRLEFDLKVDGTLLIRSPGQAADDPDSIHLTERGSPVLSGTSVAGSLRSHAGRILRTLWKNDSAAEQHLASLFGCSEPRTNDARDGFAPNTAEPLTQAKTARYTASRVIVGETRVERSRQFIQNRVKIDRLTGGAQDTALFDEQPCVGGRVKFVVEAMRPPEAEPTRDDHFAADIGLLLLLARDLSSGLLPIGGGAAVGRGILRGEVKVKLPGEDEATPLGVRCEPLQRYVDALVGRQEKAQ